MHLVVTGAALTARSVNVSGLVLVLEYRLWRGPRHRRRAGSGRRFRFGPEVVADCIRRGPQRGQRGVGQPERVARPLHLSQLFPERLILVKEHVQLRCVIVVRDGCRSVRRRQQRVVTTGQLVVVVHMVATTTAVVVVVMVTAASTTATVSPPPCRQRVEYGCLGGRSGSGTATHRRRGQPALAGRRRWQAGRRPIVRRVVLVISTRSSAAASRRQVQVTARLLSGRQFPVSIQSRILIYRYL